MTVERLLEYRDGSGGGMPSPNALLSLSKWSGRPLDEVREYAAHDCLGDLITETRVAGRGAETRSGRGIDPLVALQHLYRRRLLALYAERARLLGI